MGKAFLLSSPKVRKLEGGFREEEDMSSRDGRWGVREGGSEKGRDWVRDVEVQRGERVRVNPYLLAAKHLPVRRWPAQGSGTFFPWWLWVGQDDLGLLCERTHEVWMEAAW